MHNAPIEYLFLAAAILLILSLLASKLSGRIGVPALLLFLVVGMVAGSEGLGGIHFNDPYVAQILSIVALIFVLFSGALNTKWTHVKRVAWSGASLSTLAVVITATFVGLFTHYVLHAPILESLLFGAIISSTDAAAVFSILRSRRLHMRENVKTVIELESASNDPMAVLLTLTLIKIMTVPHVSAVRIGIMLFGQIVIGILIGWAMGKAIPWLINRFELEHNGLYPVLVIALVLLTYAVTTVIGGSGFLAVYLTGLFMATRPFKFKAELIDFHDGFTWLLQIIMFLTLGLLVYPSKLINMIWLDLAVAAFLILIARPASVFISLAFSKFKLREKAMISWVGLRGAVPIILATLPLMYNLPGAENIFNLVFFIVLTSILIQGTMILPVARWLKIRE